MTWKAIEKININKPIWILKYDMYVKDGIFCDKDVPGATKFTDCHGWYETEEEAIKVRLHFPIPNTYHIEKVYKRTLL